MANISREEDAEVRKIREENNGNWPYSAPVKSQKEILEQSQRAADRAMAELKAFRRRNGL